LQEKFAENVNQRGREFIALRLMTCLGLRYQNGQPPASTQHISTELGISTRLTEKILQTLLDARLITEVTDAEVAYVPARPLETINAHQVLLAVRCVNKAEIITRDEPVRDEIYGEFARIEEAERTAAAAVTMQALVNRARLRLTPTAEPLPVEPLPLAELPAPTLPAEPVTVKPATIELTQDAGETVTGAVHPPAPAKVARKIAEPEDNHDFPL
jgi:DNA-binding IscR family transcriptional regulator